MSIDVADDLYDIANDNWDTDIVAKPTLLRVADSSVRVIRKSHSVNTIYFFEEEYRKPTNYFYIRSIELRASGVCIGTTKAALKTVVRGFEDTIHEYLEDAGRFYDNIVVEFQQGTQTSPRLKYMRFWTASLVKHAQSITT